MLADGFTVLGLVGHGLTGGVEVEADFLERDFWEPSGWIFLGAEVEVIGVLEKFARIDGAGVFEGESAFWDHGVAIGESAVGGEFGVVGCAAFVHLGTEGVGDFVFDGEEASLVWLVHDFGEDGVFGPRRFVPALLADDFFAAPEVVVFVAAFEFACFEF